MLEFVDFTKDFACAPGEPEYESVDCSVILVCALVMSKRERVEAEAAAINQCYFFKSPLGVSFPENQVVLRLLAAGIDLYHSNWKRVRCKPFGIQRR